MGNVRRLLKLSVGELMLFRNGLSGLIDPAEGLSQHVSDEPNAVHRRGRDDQAVLQPPRLYVLFAGSGGDA